MKLKFIFNIERRLPLLKADSGTRPQPATPAAFRAHAVVLVLLLTVAFACTRPALAQQPDAPSTAKSDAAPQPDATPNAPDPPPDGGGEAMLPHFKDSRFWLSGQANFIFQTHPPFHADYSGQHSLSPNYEKATSRVMTFYTGVRLNNSTELLVDIEEAGGAALTQGFGLAGNTDLDIVRNPSLSKEPYLGRAMIHKVFALSKDKVENQRNLFSLFEELPRRRLEIRFGKFSMPDFFDLNSVGSDTHLQFINWTTDNNGAYDYAADTRRFRRPQLGIPFRRSPHAQGRKRNRSRISAMASPCGKLRIRVTSRLDPEESRRRPPLGLHQLCQHGHLSRSG
jgi:hypothetical protein